MTVRYSSVCRVPAMVLSALDSDAYASYVSLPNWEYCGVDMDWTWVDVRWQQSGWLEAFRLRLTGWLPEEVEARAIESGVIVPSRSSGARVVELTSRGQALTSRGPDSDEALRLVATVLALQGFQPNWFSRPEGSSIVSLCQGSMFDRGFIEKIRTYLDEEILSLHQESLSEE